jgi:hypothetical protein
MPLRQLITRSVVTFVALTGVAMALTWLFLGMRAVMQIGGSCASGGPYEVATPCPEGIPLVMLGGIFGGLVFLGVYATKGLRFGPRLAFLAWPALFLSLGWNFLEFGLNPPGDEGGVSVSWLFCAVLFALMGGVPLVFLFTGSGLRSTFAADGTGPSLIGTRVKSARSSGEALGKVSGRVDTGDQGGQPDDLPNALERMAALHASGALTDDEFTAAKRRLLGITDDSGNDQRGEN